MAKIRKTFAMDNDLAEMIEDLSTQLGTSESAAIRLALYDYFGRAPGTVGFQEGFKEAYAALMDRIEGAVKGLMDEFNG